MNYLVICINGILILYALYIAIVNLIKRFSYSANRVFVVISCVIAASAACTLGIVSTLIPLVTGIRLYYGLQLLVIVLLFYYMQVYPRWEKQPYFIVRLIASLPGLAVVFITVISDRIISETSSINNKITFLFGQYAIVYFIAFFLYVSGYFFALFYKLRNLQNLSFRYQLIYLFVGNYIYALSAIIVFIVLPYVAYNYDYHSITASLGGLFLVYLNHHVVIEDKYVDVKKVYTTLLYNGVILCCTVIPTYYIIESSFRFVIAGGSMPAIAVALLAFLYLVIFNRMVQPRIARLIRREYSRLEERFNAFVHALSQVEEFEGDPSYWDKFFSTTFDSLEYLCNCASILFLMYNKDEKAYIVSHSAGEPIKIKRILYEDSIVKLCYIKKSIIHKSLFFTDEVVQPFDDVRELIIKHGVEVIMPCFDDTGLLNGIILVGENKTGRPYTYEEIQFMELFRVKFCGAFNNSLQIEEVKAQQIAEHDTLVVNAVKSSIIPSQLPCIDRITMSSLFINNSNLGGEFFNAKILHKDTLAFLIADCSYSGVDAAVLALELYAAFESLPYTHDSPEKILHMLNWVVCTSRFTDRYATALCFTFHSESMSLKYINAAFNPILIYEIQKDSFIELDTKGIPIGIERDFIYESREYIVQGPCIGCVYSMGITGVVNESGIPYSAGMIKDIIRLHNSESPELIVGRIARDIAQYAKDNKSQEDISIVIFRIE